jgi:hypothetical protein
LTEQTKPSNGCTRFQEDSRVFEGMKNKDKRIIIQFRAWPQKDEKFLEKGI